MNWPSGSSVRNVWLAFISLWLPSIPWLEKKMKKNFSKYSLQIRLHLVVCEAERVSASIPVRSMASRPPLSKEILHEVHHQLPLHVRQLLLQVVALVLLTHVLKLCLRLHHPLDGLHVRQHRRPESRICLSDCCKLRTNVAEDMCPAHKPHTIFAKHLN